MLGVTLLAAGSHKEALRVLESAVDPADPHPAALMSLAYARALTGEGSSAREIMTRMKALSDRRYVSPYHRALVWVALEDPEGAFQDLSRACDDRDPAVLNVAVEPRFAPLRADSRYGELLARLGLDRFHLR